MTASLTLLALGLKLRRRWSSDICWNRWGVGVGENEVVMGAFGAKRCDSSSMLVEGSMVVVDVLVVLVL